MDLETLKKEIEIFSSKLDSADFYELLDVPRDATKRQIKRAFMGYVRKYHPDKFASIELGTLAKTMEKVLAKLSLAHTTLTNAEKRKIYDEEHPVGGKKAKAKKDLSNIFDADEHLKTAKRLLIRDEYVRAIEELHKAQSLNESESEYDAYLAWCEYRLLDEKTLKKNSVIEAFKKRIKIVIEEYSKSDDSYVFLAHIERAQGLTKAALKNYEKAFQINNHNNTARSHIRIMKKRANESVKKKKSFFQRLFGK